MRLTLRTMLAWLDDTLPPAEVRQIGQQVSETPVAGELVERIHRVTRQRRLTVPNGTGPDGVDPNIVAGYLDNELPPELVAEYEKRCLTSDVNLAEVASVHQILSLLGQKAKVPAEAKQRMYHLVRGREATPATPAPPAPRPAKPKPEPVAMAEWTPPAEPRRSALERLGPPLAVAALIALLGWSAYMSIGPAAPAKPEEGAIAQKPAAVPNPNRAANAGAIPAVPVPAANPIPNPNPNTPADKGAPQPHDAQPKGQPEHAPTDGDGEKGSGSLPPGAAGVIGKGDAFVLRYDPDKKLWQRVEPGAPVRDGDRLVTLPDTIAPMQIGDVKLTLLGDTEIKVLPGASSSRFELLRGRARIGGGRAKETIALPFDSGSVTLTLDPGAVVGLERVHRRVPGDQLPSAPGLRITSAEGSVTAEAGAATETLSGQSVLFRAPSVFAEKAKAEPPPEWLANPEPSPAAQERAKGLIRHMKPDQSPLIGLLEATSDEDGGVRADALTALAGLGQLDVVVSALSTKDDPASRQAAIAALREVARRDADSAKALRTRLLEVQGSQDRADLVEQMLVGYSAADAAAEATQAKLVDLLKHEDVGIRELAIDSLMTIGRRGDRLGYDPDKPNDGDGLKAWQDLLSRGEIRTAPVPKGR